MLNEGKTDEARDLLKHFVDAHPKLSVDDGELLALYVSYGHALEVAAEYGAAIDIYGQVEALGVGGLPDDPQAATEITIATYRKSVLSGKGREKYNAVLEAQLSAIEEKDQTYWPAKLVEAQVLSGSHNDKDAAGVLKEIAALNPNEIQTRFLSLDHAITNYDFDGAKLELDDLKTRTDDARIDAYEGRLLLKERLPQQAIAPLQDALKKNPQLAQARGWLAGTYFLLVDTKKMEEQLTAIKTPTGDGLSGMHPVALFEAGETLRDARQFDQAEKFYTDARKAANWWADPADALAQLYLETG